MKKSLIAASLALGLFGASCLGPNKAFNAVHDWNKNVSENRWINEAVFIFPGGIAAGLAYVADIIVLNSIEWWTGSNPVK